MRQRDGDGGHFVRERALEQAAGTRQLREGRLQRRTRGRDGPFLWHERGGEAAAAPCLDCSHHRTVAWREEEKRHVAAAAVTAAVTATAAVTVAVAAAAAATPVAAAATIAIALSDVAASEAGDGAAIGLCASIGAGANAESCTGADGAAASAACAKLGPSRAGACADVCSNKHAWLFVPLSDPVRTVLESSSREWRTVASDVAAPAFGAATAAVSVAPAAGASRPASIAAAPAATFRLCVTALSLSAGREHDSASFPRSRLLRPNESAAATSEPKADSRARSNSLLPAESSASRDGMQLGRPETRKCAKSSLCAASRWHLASRGLPGGDRSCCGGRGCVGCGCCGCCRCCSFLFSVCGCCCDARSLTCSCEKRASGSV
mmetsp:Transcript_29882/g.65352  ORF Transcript_29882/g.65352 Transcript_29882/m.65352 type:complete len:379 (-) Transcript_29882:732-1868(-)